ncbi:HNH endonuclease family protein [Nonomuraea longicatena]|uniref:HNH endonuclease family protein n=1 Tax=Nonomuraea longicatena TaxID=83682 RepID=A0ABN1QFB5_9ACTN
MRRVLVAILLPLIPLIPAPAEAAPLIPPGMPTAAEALTELNLIPVAAEEHADSYDRRLFPHWSTVSGACNTREEVLKRDGRDVVVDAQCAAVSGTWVSPYDGGTWTQASDIDIDHMVPLKEAWRSGAWAWTTERRKAFANSMADTQLWAVTDRVNQAKGDQDPSTWRPPLASFYCDYARSWTDVKHDWGLTMQPAERNALTQMLATCT